MIEHVSTAQSYKFYREEMDPNGIPGLDYKKGMKPYYKIISGLLKLILQKVFDGYDVKLGGKLGIIGIRGRKVEPIIVDKPDGTREIRGIAPNWGETKKLQAKDPKAKENKTKIYCFNEHSNGIKYKFYWNKIDSFITNKSYYSLTFARGARRAIPKLVAQGKEWLIVDKKEKYVRVNKFKGKD